MKRSITYLLFMLIIALIISTTSYAQSGNTIGVIPANFKSLKSASSTGGLTQIYSQTGKVTLSVDAKGSNNSTYTVRVDKPNALAKVQKAFLLSAAIPWQNIADECITLIGSSIIWDGSASSSMFSNYYADVTSIVSSTIDLASPGISNLEITECVSYNIDGTVLIVIFNDPMATEKTLVFMFGAQNTSGDDFSISLSEPIDPSALGATLDMGLGISFGYLAPPYYLEQYSVININGFRLTTSAGGQDDGESADGALITVGGIGDLNDNPSAPNALPTDLRSDDELYSLLPFINNTTTSLLANTLNPSNDDNIFLAYFSISGVAVIGEGIISSQTSTTSFVGTEHIVKAKVYNDLGEPVANRQVTFNVISGPNNGKTLAVNTDSDGEAFFPYIGDAAGIDQIQACFETNELVTSCSNILSFEWTEDPANRTELSYRFANPRIHQVVGVDHFEFDVQIKAVTSGTYFWAGNINLDFNSTTLSANAANWVSTLSAPFSAINSMGNAKYGAEISISGSNLNVEYKADVSAINKPATSSDFVEITTGYQTIITLSAEITSTTGVAGIDFNEGFMNGIQLKKLSVSPQYAPYKDPNMYDIADFTDTYVGRIYASKWGWTQINGGTVNWADEVNSSVWEGDALVPIANASNLRIHVPAHLTIPADGELTVTGNTHIKPDNGLIVESDATGTGSLITATSSGSAQVHRYMTNDAWHIVASPVSGQSISNFLVSNTNVATDDIGSRGMMDYNPAVNDWNSYFTNSTPDDLETGKGFSMRTNASSAVTFTGTLHSGNQTASNLTSGLWNCIGNPYTSAIGINEGSSSIANFLTVNAANLYPAFGAIYVWHHTDAFNGIWGEYEIYSNASTGFDIQQGQAFMIRMNTTASSVSFNPKMQIHNPALELKSTKGMWSSIKLKATLNSQKSSTTIAFNKGMTKGLDPTYDAGLLRGGSDLVLYSKLVEDNGIPFAIQALPDNEFSKMIIPLGIESKTGGEVVFTSDIINLPSDCQVILEDMLSKTFTDLSINEYKTTIEANSIGSDRFNIHTSYLTTKLDPEFSAGKLSAYSIRNVEIRVKGEVSKKAVATLYDVQGKVILVKNLDEGSMNSIQTPNIHSGIYMLYIKDNNKSQSFKIPVKE